MTGTVAQPQLFPVEKYPTSLLLVRHGRSASVVPGSPESADPPLDPAGHDQAERLAERLARVPLHAIYASDYERAERTARYVADRHGLDVTIRPALREVDLGDWENGEFRRRAAARDPEWMEFARTGRWETIPGGEHDDALRGRVRGALDEIASAHHGHQVAVVCHAGVINALLADHLGIHRSNFTVVENTSITVLRDGPDVAERLLVTVNDATHLYDPAGFASP